MADQTLIKLSADEILDDLNKALQAERQAVADYHVHARGCEHVEIREALETLRDVEREHALRLTLRITALEGSPASEPTESQPVGESLADWLTRDLVGEQWAIVEYARLVAGITDDDETAELMVELLADEIRHAGWLKSTLRELAVEK
jgi:bacterioferritin (cytochrome b1)